uniref:3-phosphoshikimate 1-carboxyvinyltransferase n=1 Tax=candidate division WOR-3 bacterium TaxID=2052148 RepID=A0A7V0Z697_UNCW3
MNLIVNSCNKISGKISVGGDKSITHRSLILGAIANGKTEIINCSHAEDCLSTIKCLRAMGVEINVEKNKIIIAGRGLKGLKEPEDVLDCGNSGTTMRLLAGLVSGQNFYSVLTGDDSLRKRPMRRIIEPLKLMGARIESRRDNFAPLGISGNRLKGIEYKMPVASAQVKSSLMIAGLYADSKTIIEEPIRSRDHTERLFKFFGIKFKRKNNKITVLPAKGFSGKIIKIPNDISSAAFFLILGILIADKLTLKDTGINPLRIGIIQVLQDAGSKITLENQRKFCNEPIADIVVKKKKPEPFIISGTLIPRLIDEIPVLAVLATQLEGRSIIKDAKELRVKETDRIRAIVTELKKFGANIKEIEDGLIIDGPTELIGTVCDSYKDHRIAMTLTIAGLIAKGRTIIKDIDCISISFPDFVNTLKEVCGEGYLQLDDTLFN